MTDNAEALRDIMHRLGDQVDSRVQDLEADLTHARHQAAVLRQALAAGSVDDLVTHHETLPSEVLAAVAPHLTVAQVRTLVERPVSQRSAQAIAIRLNSAAGSDPALTHDLVHAVGRTAVWHADRRVRLLAYELENHAVAAVARIASRDPHLSVLFGLSMGRRSAGWAARESSANVRRSLSRGRCRHHFRLGESFACAMTDPQLESDLVDLLATFPDPETAARLAAALPPLNTTSVAVIAERLADLDMLVVGVGQATTPA